MSTSLPERPCLEQYRRRAKELARSAARGDAAALSLMEAHYPQALAKPKRRLTDFQHALARSLGFPSWPKLRKAVLDAEAHSFFEAVARGDAEAVSRHLACAPDLANLRNPEGATALHIAAEAGHSGLAEVLVKNGVDPRAVFGHSAHNALSWAITVGSFGFAEEMVRLGVEPDLFCAAGMGDLKRVRAFWVDGKLRPSPSTTGSSRFTEDWQKLPRPSETDAEQVSDALAFAARHGRAEVVRWLLDHGGDPNFRGFIGGTALHWAEFSGDPETAEILRAAGASDDLVDYEFGAKPRAFGVLVTAGWGIRTLLERILSHSPGLVNIQARPGGPLHVAAKGGHREIVELLLRHGADPSLTNAEGKSAVDVAEESGFPEIARFLRG